MRHFLKLVFSRFFLVCVFILAQLVALAMMLFHFSEQYAIFQLICYLLALVMVVYIINREGSSAFKIGWIITILFAPIFGVPMYIIFGKNHAPESKREMVCGMRTRYYKAIRDVPSRGAEIKDLNPDAAIQSAYLENCAGAPVFTNTQTEYFKLGDDMFPRMLEELHRARRFIFLEYFIIKPGVMWDSILDILAQKVHEGVDVRIIYDDMGCIRTLPSDYCQRMESIGIQCCAFQRFQPVLTGSFNNRDHRKICVIDGVIAFTGGINLSDEYINAKLRFGHWLDCGIMVKGNAAYSFTLMFLSMWDHIRKTEDDPNDFLPYAADLAGVGDDGYVQPFADTPIDDENVSLNAYLNMMSRAQKYIYICTPYLVISNEIMTALTSAAKSGIDVRLITPGVPDKWYVHAVTRSYYAPLVRAGVKIYEYIPGFIHSKTIICDDEVGICGTINLDYRSLFLHHECAVWMYKSSAIADIKDSFLTTLPKCAEITEDSCNRRPFVQKLGQSLLRVFAPLM